MKIYAIRWKSIVTGTVGIGTKRFEKEEAGCLVKELNDKYPDIFHEAIIPAPTPAEAAPAEPSPTPKGS